MADILKLPYLEETLFKTSNIVIEASLVEAFICAKFQVKIRKYDFSEDPESYR
jgi:hypothetical protein